MSFVWRLLAVVALSAMPVTSSLAASSSPNTAVTSSAGAHGNHKVTPGSHPASVPEAQAPGIARSHPMIAPGKSIAKPLRTPNGGQGVNRQGVNGAVKGPGLQPSGNVAPRGMGGPNRTAVNLGVHTLPRGGASTPGPAPGMSGGVHKRAGEINGSTMVTRGFAPAKIAPPAKANAAINGTGLGRK
jgi:hypothetical protein